MTRDKGVLFRLLQVLLNLMLNQSVLYVQDFDNKRHYVAGFEFE